MQISLFLVHAEDQMMSAETIITLVRKFLEIIEKEEGISND
jgi:cellobiose PTS system EIIA component